VPETVDGSNAPVLQASRDLGLEQEAVTASGVVGLGFSELLQCHLPIELGILGDPDLPEAPSGVETEEAEPGSPGT
jgi:hypothetical protein